MTNSKKFFKIFFLATILAFGGLCVAWFIAVKKVKAVEEQIFLVLADPNYSILNTDINNNEIKYTGFPFSLRLTHEGEIKIKTSYKDENPYILETEYVIKGFSAKSSIFNPTKFDINAVEVNKTVLGANEKKDAKFVDFNANVGINPKGNLSLNYLKMKYGVISTVKDGEIISKIGLEDINVLYKVNALKDKKYVNYFDFSANKSTFVDVKKNFKINFDKFTLGLGIESSIKDWDDLGKLLIEFYDKFNVELKDAIANGEDKLPIIENAFNSLEDDKVKLYLNFNLTEKDSNLEFKGDFNLKDKRLEAKINGSIKNLDSFLEQKIQDGIITDVVANEQKQVLNFIFINDEADKTKQNVKVSIKDGNIIVNNMPMPVKMPQVDFSSVSLVTEEVGAAFLKDFSAGDFHLARAKKKDTLKRADVKFKIAKGYIKDKKYKDAMKWLQKSSDQKFPLAYFYLGYLHHDGLGVSKNKAMAMKYIKLMFSNNYKFEWVKLIKGEFSNSYFELADKINSELEKNNLNNEDDKNNIIND